MVDRLGETELADTGLEAALQEIFDLQGKNVIKLHARVVQHTDTDQSTNQGIAFEETLGILLVKGKQLTACGLASKICIVMFKAFESTW
jgi:hypothetical protein